MQKEPCGSFFDARTKKATSKEVAEIHFYES